MPRWVKGCLIGCGALGALGVVLLVVGAMSLRSIVRAIQASGPSAIGAPGKETLASAPTLLAARKGFRTALGPEAPRTEGRPEPAPGGMFDLVQYRSEVGPLWAYVTPDPRDGRRRPAVLWAHGGFGGIAGGWLWDSVDRENDQTASAFREAGFVLMAPSWRGENDNPGRFELFYGEVNDLLWALEHLRSLPYVDPNRVYVAGHSTGGTMALLAAEASPKIRAAFSFGGAPDVTRVVADGSGYGNTPFDYRNTRESQLRSPIYFLRCLQTPTFYFEGEESAYPPDAERMEELATRFGKPFRAFTVQGGDHFTILHPLTRLVAAKIAADTGPRCNIRIEKAEVERAFAAGR
jgi:dipeptidyl aminopeptidase/acylaminoacyl peptidase